MIYQREAWHVHDGTIQDIFNRDFAGNLSTALQVEEARCGSIDLNESVELARSGIQSIELLYHNIHSRPLNWPRLVLTGEQYQERLVNWWMNRPGIIREMINRGDYINPYDDSTTSPYPLNFIMQSKTRIYEAVELLGTTPNQIAAQNAANLHRILTNLLSTSNTDMVQRTGIN